MRTNKKLFKDSEKVKQRYATRKLKVGMVSLLMGFTFIFGVNSLANVVDFLPVNSQVEAAPMPTINAQQDLYAGYISKGWFPYYSTGPTTDQAMINRLTKVEKIPLDDNDREKGQQRWKITYNSGGVLGPIGIRQEADPIYPANPRLSFSLSKDMEIVGDIKYSMYDQTGKNLINSIEIAPNKNMANNFLTSNKDGDRATLSDLTYKGPSEFARYIVSRGKPSPELQWMRDEAGEIGKNYVDYLSKYEDQLYVFLYNTADDHKKQITVEFATKSNKKISNVEVQPNVYSQELVDTLSDPNSYIGVTGTYTAFDQHWTTYEFSQTSRISLLPDSDKDGLPDAFEIYIGSDPHKVNTDGDSRDDGVEVENIIPQEFPLAKGLWKIEGTDPTVAPPKAPKKILGQTGEIIRGKARPHTTMAVRVYKIGTDNSVGWQSIAETISDADGNYELQIGRIFKRTDVVNKYGNNIAFKNIDKLEPDYNYLSAENPGNDPAIANIYNKETGVYGGVGYEAKVEEWSDGFDGRPLFTKPEIAIPSIIVPTIQDKYDNFKPEPGVKVPVENPDHLTQEEKDKIKDEIWKELNKKDPETGENKNQQLVDDLKDGEKSIHVDDKGNVTIDVEGNGPDGKPNHFDIPAKDVISQTSAPIEAKQEGVNIVGTTTAPKGTPVKLLNEDGNPVTDSSGKPITGTVGDNDTVTIPVPEDKRGELNGKNVKLQVEESGKSPSVSNDVTVSFKSAPAEDVHQDGRILTAQTKAPAGTVVKLQDSDGNYIKDDSGRDIETTVTEGLGGNNIVFNLTPEEMNKVGGKEVKLSVEETGKAPNNDGSINVLMPPKIYKEPKKNEKEVQVLLPKEAKPGEILKVTVGNETKEIEIKGPVNSEQPVTVNFDKPFETSEDSPTEVRAVITDTSQNTSSPAVTTVRNVEMSSKIQDVKQIRNAENGNAVVTGKLPKNVTGSVKVCVNENGEEKVIAEPLLNDDRVIKAEIPKEYNGKDVYFKFQESPEPESTTTYTPSTSDSVKIDLTAPSVPTPAKPVSGAETIKVIPSRETDSNPETIAKEGDVITVKDSEGNVIGEKTLTAREADEARDNMTVDIPLNRPLKPSEKLTVDEEDKFGNRSGSADVTVKSDAEVAGELKSPEKTKVDNINSLTPEEKKEVAKAVYEANKDKKIALKNKEPEITVDDKGNVTGVTFEDGSELKPANKDEAIKNLAQNDTVVEKTVSAPVENVKQVFEDSGNKITAEVPANKDGTYPEGTVTVTDENGVPIDAVTGKPNPDTKNPLTGTVGPDGKISIPLPDGVETGTKVKLSFQEYGKDKPSVSDPITIDKEAPEAPFIGQAIAGESQIKIYPGAKTEVGDTIKVTVEQKDGDQTKTVTFEHKVTADDLKDKSKPIIIDVNDKLPGGLSEGEKITAETTDAYNNTSTPRESTVIGKPPVVEAPYEKDTSVKIQLPEGAEAGNSLRIVVITEENGKKDYKIINTTVGPGQTGGSTITVDIPESEMPNGLKDGDEIVAQLNKGSFSKPVAVKGIPVVEAPLANDKDVKVKLPKYAKSGDEVKVTVTDKNGGNPKYVKWTIPEGTQGGSTVNVPISSIVPDGLKENQKVTAKIVSEAEEGRESEPVTVKGIPAPTVETPTVGENKITVVLPENANPGEKVNVEITAPDGKKYTAVKEIPAGAKAGDKVEIDVPSDLTDGLPADAKITAKIGDNGKESSPVAVNGIPVVETPTAGDKYIDVKLPNYAKAGDKIVITINQNEQEKKLETVVPVGNSGGDTIKIDIPEIELKPGDKVSAQVNRDNPKIEGKSSVIVTVKGIPEVETPSAGNTKVKVKLPDYVKSKDKVQVIVKTGNGKEKIVDYTVPETIPADRTVEVPVTDEFPDGLEEGQKVSARIGTDGKESPEVTVEGVPVVEVPTEGDDVVKVKLPSEIGENGTLVITVTDSNGTENKVDVENLKKEDEGKVISVNLPKEEFPDGLKKDQKITAQIDHGSNEGKQSEPVTVKALPAPTVDEASSGDKKIYVILPEKAKPGDEVIVTINPVGGGESVETKYIVPKDANISGIVEVPVEVPADKFPNGLNTGDKITAKIGENGTVSPEVTVEGIPIVENLTEGDTKIKVKLPEYAKAGNELQITVIDANTKEKTVITKTIDETAKNSGEMTVDIKDKFPDGLDAGDRVKANIKIGDDIRKPSKTVTVSSIPAPTVEAPTAGDENITVNLPEEAKPGEKVKVTVKDKDGKIKTIETVIPENNNGTVEVPVSKTDFPDGLQAGDKITARVRNGIESKPVDVKGLPAVEVPVANDKDIKVTLPDYVKTEDKVNITVTVPAKDGQPEKTVNVPYEVGDKEKGGDTVTVPIGNEFPDGLAAGDKVTAQVGDDGKQSQPVTVKEMPAPEVTVPSAGDDEISLKLPEEVEPGEKAEVIVTVTDKDGNKTEIPLTVDKVNNDRKVDVPITKDNLPKGLVEGDKVSAQVGENGKQSKPVDVLGVPSVETPTANDSDVKVKLPDYVKPGDKVNVTVTVPAKDGQPEKTVNIPYEVGDKEKGGDTVSVPLPKSDFPNGLAAGDKVSAKIGENGKQSQPVEVKEMPAPEVTAPYAGSSTIDVKVPENAASGDTIKITVTDNEGKNPKEISYTVPNGTKGGDIVKVPVTEDNLPGGLKSEDEITAKIGANGKVSGTVSVKAIPAPVVVSPIADAQKITVKLPNEAKPGDTVKVIVHEEGEKNPVIINYEVPEGTKGGDSVEVPVTRENLPNGLKVGDKITAKIGNNGDESKPVDVTAMPAPEVTAPEAGADKITVKLPKEAKSGDVVWVTVTGKDNKPVNISFNVPEGTKVGGTVEVPVTEKNLPNGLKAGDSIVAKVGRNGTLSAPVEVKKKAVTEAQPLNPKITVKDKDKLTDKEKDEVKKAVEKANPGAKDITVGDDGTVHFTDNNGDDKKISPENAVEEKPVIIQPIAGDRDVTVTIPKHAEPGDKVNITVTPKDGSKPVTITYTVPEGTKGGQDVKISVEKEIPEGLQIDDKVTASVTPKDSETAGPVATATVVPNSQVAKPDGVVEGATNVDVTLPDEVKPGDRVEITVTPKDGSDPKTITYTVPEGTKGGEKVTIEIGKEFPNGVKEGDKIDIKVIGSNKSDTVTVNKKPSVGTVTIEPVTEGDKNATAQVPAGANAAVKVNGTELPADKVDVKPDGKVTITAPDGEFHKGDKIEVTASKDETKPSSADTIVGEKPSIGTVTIEPVTEGEEHATAQVPKDSKVTVKVNGTELPADKVDVKPDGKVIITAPDGKFNAKDKIEVTASKDGYKPSSADTTVTELPSVGTVTVRPVKDGDKTATAEVPEGSKVTVTVNGKEVPADNVEVTDGKVTITAPDGEFHKNDKIEVTASKDGTKPSTGETTVAEKPEAGKTVVDPVKDGDKTATAQIPEGSTDVKVTVDGNEVAAENVEVTPDGKVTITAPDGEFHNGERIVITSSKDGAESTGETIVAEKPEIGKIEIDPITEGDKTATAKIPEGSTDVKVTVNGKENPDYNVEVSPDGKVTITAPEGGFQKDNIVRITAKDKGTEINADTRVNEKEEKQLGTVTVNPVTEGDKEATAKVPEGSKVTVKINGKEVPEGDVEVQPDGTVKIKAPKDGFKKDERIEVTASKDGFKPSTGETSVKDKNSGKPVIKQPSVGDTDIKVVVPDNIKPGDKITVVITDKDGKNPKEVVTAAPDNVKGGETVSVNIGKEIPGGLADGDKVSVTVEHETSSKTVTVGKTPSSGGSSGGGGGSSSSPSSVTSTRVAGPDRAATGAEVSKMAYPNGAKVVILANSEKFSDVLTAMPYGKTIHAPVLYTNFKDIPDETMKEIKRLGAEKIILIGGDKTISVLEQRALEGMGYKTDRVNGRDRYDTAKLIAERMKAAGAKGINNVVIASGEKFPDALSIAPLAVREETPILLAQKNTLSRYTIKGLEDLHVNKMYISGGKMSVSATVEAKLKPYTKQAITRFAGHDRYETSVAITKALMPNAKKSVFASGEIFPDALLAGELVDYYNAPLMLLRKNEVPKSVENYVEKSSIEENIIVGGTNTISDSVVTKLEDIERR